MPTDPIATIVLVTHRAEPRFQWFADSLANQIGEDPLEVVVVDARHSPERGGELARIVDGRFPLRHVAPKPTPYAGPARRTSRDYSALASARNTGVVYARAPYIVFTDDSGILMDGWWREVRTAASLGYVLAGTYENRRGMVVEDGRMVQANGSAPEAVDSRYELGDDEALVRIVGSQVFGCGLGVLRERLIAVNGFDELCDPIGGEDTHLGVRLEWTGERLFFSRRMMMVKDADRHSPDRVVRVDRGAGAEGPLEESFYMQVLAGFGVHERTVLEGARNCSHLCLDLLYGTRSIASLGNCYELGQLSPSNLEQLSERFPDRYWATGAPLAQL